MIPYGKTSQHAIAAVSRLAEVHGQNVRLSSADVALSRGLPQPIVAKVLTVLSQAGLLIGSPGPGGGYALARHPREISLMDVAELFDRQEESLGCPYGPTYCGVGPQCPLHDQLQKMRDQIDRFLRSNNFAQFIGHEPGKIPTSGKKR